MMQFFLRVAPTNKRCTFVASSGAERELFEVCWLRVTWKQALSPGFLTAERRLRILRGWLYQMPEIDLDKLKQICGIWIGADCD